MQSAHTTENVSDDRYIYIYLLGIYLKERVALIQENDLPSYIYISTIHNSEHIELTQMPCNLKHLSDINIINYSEQ